MRGYQCNKAPGKIHHRSDMIQFPGERYRFLDCAVQSNISLQTFSTNRVARLVLADANFGREQSTSRSSENVF